MPVEDSPLKQSPIPSLSTMIQIQILSDLHLEIERSGAPEGKEFYHYDIPVRAEHLALLGDIGWTMQEELFMWLKAQLKLFKVILFLSGNHEPYRSTIDDSVARMTAFSEEVHVDASLGEFIYLNRTRYDLSSNLTILGCTLWSALNPDDLDILRFSINDFKRIDSFSPETYMSMHRADLEWLNATVTSIAKEEHGKEVIILTHHAPTVKGTGDPKFEGGFTNSAFATELTSQPCWNADIVKLWAFGHTHWCCDFMRNGIRVYSNQRGYGNGSADYDPGKVVEV